ncbi:DUF1269 domain-containing protein [Nocardioides sp. NPDC047086]|uniref:DUF1269 domain-containing protein n=1 Tax=Nocardioides sp. NPDC047086 TaxID=3154810 RepID=UPI0033F9A548
MSTGTLTAWRFDTPEGAEETLHALEELAREGLIDVHDAAALSWPPGTMKLRTSQLHAPADAGGGSLGGSFWGLLLGYIFFVPLLGAALGTATGLYSGVLSAVGIDDGFINRVRDRVTPGTSALFVLATEGVVDTIRDVLGGRLPSDPIFTDLTAGQDAALRRAFGTGDSPVAGESAGAAAA